MKRFQIIKKMPNGEVFRASADLEDIDAVIEEAKRDARWIVVKDRQRRLRQQIWRRNEGVIIQPWWLEE